MVDNTDPFWVTKILAGRNISMGVQKGKISYTKQNT